MEHWDHQDRRQVHSLLVDPRDFTRQCLSQLLEINARDFVVHGAADAEAVPAETLELCGVALLVCDGLPRERAFERYLRVLHARKPDLPIVVLGALEDVGGAWEVMRQGVRGYLSPLLDVEQIVAALRLVISGGICIGPPSGSGRAEGPEPDAHRRDAAPPRLPLTPREAEVLRHLRQGKPNKIIAFELKVSENTVKVHVARILKKLRAPNRTALACLPPGRLGPLPSAAVDRGGAEAG